MFLRSLFLCPRTEFGQTLRASRFRTPLSLRDISLGRTETSVVVSVARTFFRDWGVLLGLFFLRLREEFWTVLVSAPSRSHERAVGGAAVGGMAAHGLVNGMSGASPTGMSEANLPRLHLRSDSLKNCVSVSSRCILRDGATSVFAMT